MDGRESEHIIVDQYGISVSMSTSSTDEHQHSLTDGLQHSLTQDFQHSRIHDLQHSLPPDFQHSLTQDFQHSLTQLAHSFQAHETIGVPVEQIAECFDHLHDTDRTALDRLFSLIYHQHGSAGSAPEVNSPCNKHGAHVHSNAMSIAAPSNTTTAVARTRSSPSRRVTRAQRRTAAAAAAAATGRRSSASSDSLQSAPPPDLDSPSSATSTRGSPAAPSLVTIARPPACSASSASSATACPAFALANSGLAGRTGTEELSSSSSSSSWSSSSSAAAAAAASGLLLHFSATLEALLHTCMSEPAAFLRAVASGNVALPNGQGWEAAIVTKRNNADLRDLTRIFHRFECYNIYQHVVDAGYHTGSHWIRDMRPMLAERLRRDFPASFVDQKAANKCLNWVDHGCRYREWAEKLSAESGLNLGYLIALPCDVPHSTYTSRCTKEQIAATVIELVDLGIQQVVEQMRLAVLAHHIVESLHEMTSGKGVSASVPHTDASGPPIDAPVPLTAPHTATHMDGLDHVLTPPDLSMLDGVTPLFRSIPASNGGLTDGFTASGLTFGAFADSWLEDWSMEDMGGCAVLDTNTRSPRLSDSPYAVTDPFHEWYQQ